MANISATYVGYSVDALAITTSSRISPSSAVNDIQHMIRSGATDHVTANLGIVKDNSVQQHTTLLVTSPFTGQPWTRTEIDGAEFGVKAV